MWDDSNCNYIPTNSVTIKYKQGGRSMRLLSVLKTLATHRVTYKFLVVLAASIGLASSAEHIGELETLLCSLLTCVP